MRLKASILALIGLGLFLAWSIAETLDGARLTVVNAPIARSRLGIIVTTTNGVLVAAGAGVSIATNVTGSNVTYTFSVTAGGTNTLWVTNGVTLGSAGTVAWDTGVTGYLAGAVAHLGVNVSGGTTPPGGNNGNLQYNNSGVFGGSNDIALRFALTESTLAISNGIGVNAYLNIIRNVGANGLYNMTLGPDALFWTNKTQRFTIQGTGIGNSVYFNTNMDFVSGLGGPTLGEPGLVWPALYVTTINADGAVDASSATLTNGLLVGADDGGSGKFGIINGFDAAAFAYRQMLKVEDSSLVIGTNDAANVFYGSENIFAGPLTGDADNTRTIGHADNRWRDGWFANTLNTTGLVAGVSYAALTSGRYNDETNQFNIYVGNGSTRTNFLNSASAVGAIHCVTDRGGTAAGTNLFVKPSSGLVNNAATDSLTANFECRCYQFDGTNWWRISKS